MVQHCCDVERVFGYRALRFASGDEIDLPGWDQNFYAVCGHCDLTSKEELAEEFAALRRANLRLLHRLEPSAFDRFGMADGKKVSVRTIFWLMAGHWIHHEKVLRVRLQPAS